MPPGNAPRECPPGTPLGRRRAPVNSAGVTPPVTVKRALLAGGVIASGVMATGAWCGAAYAQPFQGLYVNVDGGFNWRDGVGVSSVLPTLPGPWVGGSRIQGAPGWVALGSAGYGFGNGLRLELEGNYRQSDFNKLTGTPAPTSTGGQFRTYGVMANAMFDLDIGWPWLFPYLGGGAGYAWRDANNIGLTGANGTLPLYNFSGTSGGFAAQAIAGLSFPVPNVPGLSLTAEYRFLAVFGGASFDGTVTEPGPGGKPLGPFRQRLALNNEFNNGVLLGIRYAFGVQPPPPPPAPRATTRACRCAGPRRSRPNWCATACRATRSRSRASARRICWCRPPPACASRRIAASRSSSAEPASAGNAPPVRSRRRAAAGARRRRMLCRAQRHRHDVRTADRARHPIRQRAEAGSRRVCARRRPVGQCPVGAGGGVPVRRRLADRLPRAVSLRRRGPGRARVRHRDPRLPGLSAGPVSRLPAGLRAGDRVGVGACGGAWRRIDAVRDGPLGGRVQRDDAGAG